MEVLRTLGLLGALEPNRYAAITSFLQSSDKERNKQRDEGKSGTGDARASPAHAAKARYTALSCILASWIRISPIQLMYIQHQRSR
jgi:hypothetical protein